eukprot:s4373_g4.t1
MFLLLVFAVLPHVPCTFGGAAHGHLDGLEGSLWGRRDGMVSIHRLCRGSWRRSTPTRGTACAGLDSFAGTSSTARWFESDRNPGRPCGLGLQPGQEDPVHEGWGPMGQMGGRKSLWGPDFFHAAEPPMTPNPLTGPTDRKLKVSQVLDQGDDGEFWVETEDTRAKWLERHRLATGGLPSAEEEPSLEQLSALARRVAVQDSAPYTDFGVFVPFGNRALRSSKYRTFVMTGEGTYSARELPGPSTFIQWRACYRVFKSSMIMLDCVGLSNLHNYETHIERLTRLYGSAWHLVYSADDLCRSTQANRTRARVLMDVKSGKSPPDGWDPERSWDTVYRLLVLDDQFWQEQVHGPALAWVAAGSRGTACSSSHARGLASHPSSCGQRSSTHGHYDKSFNKGTKGRKEETCRFRKRRTCKVQGGKRRPSKRERERRRKRSAKAEMFWLEQWEWALRFFSAWTGLCFENTERASLYDMQLSGPSQQVVPTKEGGRMMAGDTAPSGGEGRPDEPPGKRRRKGDKSSPSEEPERHEGGGGGDADEEVDPLSANTLEEYFKKRVFVFVHHYAGANDPLTAAVKEDALAKGIKLKCIGIEKATGAGNLLADEPYATHMQWAERGYIDAFHAGFPCSTFSKLRFREAEGLPGPVRTLQEPYGRAANTPQEQRECDEGTVMASRSINIAKVIAERKGEARVGAVATLENPPPSSQKNHLSAWELPEMGAFLALEGINFALFNTCGYEPDIPMGQRHFKPQQFAGTLLGLKSLDKSCMCTGGHEAVVGRERSRASAEYPKALCVHYAKLLTTHLMMMGKEEYLAYRMKKLNETLPTAPKVSYPKGKPNEAELADAVPQDAPQEQASSSGATNSWQGGFGKYGMLRPSRAAASRAQEMKFTLEV